jgi:hypothetical protein
MTKDELYEKWKKNANAEYIIPTLDAFFENNIVIPKGDDPHPDSKAIHEWAEDTTKQLQYNREDHWYTDYPFGTATRYRIKPSEPIYEWQWQYPSHKIEMLTSSYMTVEEVEKTGIKLWCKTNTKRERK